MSGTGATAITRAPGASWTRPSGPAPNDVKLLLPYSYVARRSGRWDEAIATMRREVDLDPRNPTALDDLANTLIYVQPAGPPSRCSSGLCSSHRC